MIELAVLTDEFKNKEESLCWTCSKAYALECVFHRNPDKYSWEEKLEIPSLVAFKNTAIDNRGSIIYKVLECPKYTRSAPRQVSKNSQNKTIEDELGDVTPDKNIESVPTNKKERSRASSIRKKQHKCIMCGDLVNGDIICSSNLCLIMSRAAGINIKKERERMVAKNEL